MREIIISATEKWIIPDLHTVSPALDLFCVHQDTSAHNGDVDTLNISGKTYKSVFFNHEAVFYFGDLANREATGEPIVLSLGVGMGEAVNVWQGALNIPRALPEVLFYADYRISMIPNDGLMFFYKIGADFWDYRNLGNSVGIEIGAQDATAYIWLSDDDGNLTPPENAKIVRVLTPCDDDVEVEFLLLNGERRVWFLHEKRKTAEFNEISKHTITATFDNQNKKSYQISEGENKLTRTLFIENLRPNELDEISQLAVSRWVKVDGQRVDVIRRSAIFSGNNNGSFSIEISCI